MGVDGRVERRKREWHLRLAGCGCSGQHSWGAEFWASQLDGHVWKSLVVWRERSRFGGDNWGFERSVEIQYHQRRMDLGERFEFSQPEWDVRDLEYSRCGQRARSAG